MAMLIARRYVDSGRVQRVGIRFFVEDAAHREGVRGFVRNQHDGTVEVVAEADAESMLRFEMALRRGPAGARVDNVDTLELAPAGTYHTFSIVG